MRQEYAVRNLRGFMDMSFHDRNRTLRLPVALVDATDSEIETEWNRLQELGIELPSGEMLAIGIVETRRQDRR